MSTIIIAQILNNSIPIVQNKKILHKNYKSVSLFIKTWIIIFKILIFLFFFSLIQFKNGIICKKKWFKVDV